jgi:IS605 OrfB family transposase
MGVSRLMGKVENLFSVYCESFKLAYAGFTYKELRVIHKGFNSEIDANAIYDAHKFLRTVLKIHNYPKGFNPCVLLRRQDFRLNGSEASIIYKPKDRLIAQIFPTPKQLDLINQSVMKGARLVKRDRGFFLNVVLNKEVDLPSPKECETVIGVDIGINYLAVCSAYRNGKFANPVFFKGGEWKHLCDRKRKITNYKEFKHLTRRQHSILHTVSKKIVEYAMQHPKPVIILEKLGNFNNNSESKRWNFLLGNWARRKLQFMIEYKAKWESIPVVYVNPAYTSLYCHYCGSKGKREGLAFKCRDCGRTYNADANAAMNLAKRFRQLLNEPKAVTEERSQADMRSVWEGETRLPRQACMRLGNGKQMNGMMVTRTVSLPMATGGG